MREERCRLQQKGGLLRLLAASGPGTGKEAGRNKGNEVGRDIGWEAVREIEMVAGRMIGWEAGREIRREIEREAGLHYNSDSTLCLLKRQFTRSGDGDIVESVKTAMHSLYGCCKCDIMWRIDQKPKAGAELFNCIDEKGDYARKPVNNRDHAYNRISGNERNFANGDSHAVKSVINNYHIHAPNNGQGDSFYGEDKKVNYIAGVTVSLNRSIQYYYRIVFDVSDSEDEQ